SDAMQGAPLLSRGRRWLGIFGGRFTPWLARSTTSPRELNAARITCGSLERRLVVASQSASSSSPQLCRAAEQRDERAPLHSITSSAQASSMSMELSCTGAGVASRAHANNGQQGKSPGSEAGARLGFACHGGNTVTNRTVMDACSLHNSAISEIRLL